MQYVFVLLRGEGFYVGGHLWRSDNFGNGAWEDVTAKLTGQLFAFLLLFVNSLSILHPCISCCGVPVSVLQCKQPGLVSRQDQQLHATSVSAAAALPAGAATSEDMLGVLDLHFHLRNPERILFQGPGFYFWVTEDYGRTYKALPTPGEATLGFWMELKIHPNVPEWLLAKVKRKECLRDLSSAECAHDLFISKVCGAYFPWS